MGTILPFSRKWAVVSAVLPVTSSQATWRGPNTRNTSPPWARRSHGPPRTGGAVPTKTPVAVPATPGGLPKFPGGRCPWVDLLSGSQGARSGTVPGRTGNTGTRLVERRSGPGPKVGVGSHRNLQWRSPSGVRLVCTIPNRVEIRTSLVLRPGGKKFHNSDWLACPRRIALAVIGGPDGR